MMNGHKLQYFKLGLRYGFYFFLSVFTLFIWALWLGFTLSTTTATVLPHRKHMFKHIIDLPCPIFSCNDLSLVIELSKTLTFAPKPI